MSAFPFCCEEVGTGGPPNVVHTIINIGGFAESYVIGTGPNPFELRTIQSSDASLTVTQNADNLDLVVDFAGNVSIANVGGGAETFVIGSGPNPFKLRTGVSSDGTVTITQLVETIDYVVDFGANVSIINVGGFAAWFKVGTENPFELKTAQSSDGSVTITVNANDIDFTVSGAAAHDVIQEESLATKSTTSTTYQLITTLPGDAKMKDGEVWRLDLGMFVCHPPNVFTVNTLIEWRIETAAAVFTPIDEWQINDPITIQVGEPSIPFSMHKKVTLSMDAPRMQCYVKMSALQASATFVEMPRWGGDEIDPAP